MHKYYYTVKDSWISETTSSANYGGDPVLELRKKYSGDTLSGVSRMVTQFDLTDIEYGELFDILRIFITGINAIDGE